MSRICVRKATKQDQQWIDWVTREKWVGDFIVSRGHKHIPSRLPGLVATIDEKPCGLLTFHVIDNEFEIVTLNRLQERRGIGKALVRMRLRRQRRGVAGACGG